MRYDFREIEALLKADAPGAIAGWEGDYQTHIDTVASRICRNHSKSPVVLLSGPSGSAKTSTGERLCTALRGMGMPATLISMDNYFLSLDDPDFPKTPEGTADLEAPECVNTALLDSHFALLEAGEAVRVPRYDFPTHSRIDGGGPLLQPEQGGIFVFEGIHALNDTITSAHPSAYRVYVSPDAEFTLEGETLCTGTQLRFLRRLMRDYLFRGASAELTLSLWGNVVKSEKKHILPYAPSANAAISTALPYELCVLKPLVEPLLMPLGADVPQRDMVDSVLKLLKTVSAIPADLTPDISILREFIGPREKTERTK